ncbi:MAG TPA: DinB family protein [Flavobacteriales bacterium]|jgi:uncharacterized damage-inducible protein DinB|nr:DinB family protein [Flavobacteriales bacterium]QQS73263.1 MAG: DinB family protein [Flavobacteriales bacterium]HQV39823.1 DinB family protein [Flavobacteriales bacterium]HQW32989.1 DinB family protein [Flavobacteriales bacterium]HQY01725.1 DinB family protein [Flavobacteriales bacterium]
MIEHLSTLFDRDLQRLRTEIEVFNKEADLWEVSGSVTNSAGNLCLHLCGNLEHFIGGVLGGSGYVRDREHEFAARNIPRSMLLAGIDSTRDALAKAFSTMSDEHLDKTFPLKVLGDDMTIAYFMLHLEGHLNYHLGQVNYLRRML